MKINFLLLIFKKELTIKMFSAQGIQANVGHYSDNIVYKISNKENYDIRHETIVSKALKKTTKFVPHFCEFVKSKPMMCDKTSRYPFDERNKSTSREEEVIFYKYIPKTYDLCSLVEGDVGNTNVLYSCMKQVMLALCIANQKVGFTHYDLHCGNVLINDCDSNIVMLYVLENEEAVVIPTFGYTPKIIDYGRSYVRELENNNPIYYELSATSTGHTTYRENPMFDVMMLLYNCGYGTRKEIIDFADRIFKNILKDINRKRGFSEKERGQCILARLYDKVHKSLKVEGFLLSMETISILTSILVTPLHGGDYSSLEKDFKYLCKELNVLNTLSGSITTNKKMLKRLVSILRLNISKYVVEEEISRDSYIDFEKRVNIELDRNYKYISSRTVFNYKNLLDCFINFSYSLEGYIHKEIEREMEASPFNNVLTKDFLQVYKMFEERFPTSYTFIKNLTKVCVVHAKSEICYT